MRNRPKNEAGNCGAIIALVMLGILLLWGLGSCIAWLAEPIGSDCYSTPGAESGSAQNQRDIERCLS